jgi:hypothetical protein
MQNKFKATLAVFATIMSLTLFTTPAAANDVDPCTLLAGNWFGQASYNDPGQGLISLDYVSVAVFYSQQYGNKFSMYFLVNGSPRESSETVGTMVRYRGTCSNGILSGENGRFSGKITTPGIINLSGNITAWSPYASGFQATLHKAWMFGTPPQEDNQVKTNS